MLFKLNMVVIRVRFNLNDKRFFYEYKYVYIYVWNTFLELILLQYNVIDHI